MAENDMRAFWDERAREDPYFFVHSDMRYKRPDLVEFWASGRHALDRLLDTLGVSISPGQVAVEIGCGIGRLTRPLAERAGRVLALDVSERMLELAREEHADLANVEWILGDGSSLAGVPDGAADLCVSHVVFQHIPDPAITLGYVKEMGRVLRPGGWAAFVFSNDPDVHRARGRRVWRRALAAVGRAPRGMEALAWLGSAIEVERLERAAVDAEMDLERLEYPGTQYCAALLRRSGPGT